MRRTEWQSEYSIIHPPMLIAHQRAHKAPQQQRQERAAYFQASIFGAISAGLGCLLSRDPKRSAGSVSDRVLVVSSS